MSLPRILTLPSRAPLAGFDMLDSHTQYVQLLEDFNKSPHEQLIVNELVFANVSPPPSQPKQVAFANHPPQLHSHSPVTNNNLEFNFNTGSSSFETSNLGYNVSHYNTPQIPYHASSVIPQVPQHQQYSVPHQSQTLQFQNPIHPAQQSPHIPYTASPVCNLVSQSPHISFHSNSPQVPYDYRTPQVPFQSPQVPLRSPTLPYKSPHISFKSPQITSQSPHVPFRSPHIPLQSPSATFKSPHIPLKSPHVPFNNSPVTALEDSLLNLFVASPTLSLNSEASDEAVVAKNEYVKKKRAYKCTMEGCHKEFTRKYNLKSHFISFHAGEKPFACPFCTSSFSRVHDQKRHIKSVHMDSRPHKCPHCALSFSRSDALKRHLSVEKKRLNEQDGDKYLEELDNELDMDPLTWLQGAQGNNNAAL